MDAVQELNRRPGALPLRTLLGVLRTQTETGLHPTVYMTLAKTLCERGEPKSVVTVLQTRREPPPDAAVRAVLDTLGIVEPAGP